MAELIDLPEDLMFRIFLMLAASAKPLMQLKSVCILWYKLISSTNFAELHDEQTLAQSNPKLRFVFSAFDLVFSNSHLSSAEFDTFDGIRKLKHPFRIQGSAHVMGSCRGLLCLSNYLLDHTLFLYNPTTQTHKRLPLPNPPSDRDRYSFGFGYDGVSRDYKCVSILQSDSESQVMVYSLKMDSWTRAPDVPFPSFPNRQDGVFFNGTLHWVHDKGLLEDEKCFIVGFNLGSHTFTKVPLPSFEEKFTLSTGVLDGCLCLIVNHHCSDIWIMKEYGVVESWTRLYEVKPPQNPLFLRWPIAYSLNRQKLFLQDSERVFSLDLQTMVLEDIKVCNFRKCSDTLVCTENLMMLKDTGSEALETDHQQGNISADEISAESMEE